MYVALQATLSEVCGQPVSEDLLRPYFHCLFSTCKVSALTDLTSDEASKLLAYSDISVSDLNIKLEQSFPAPCQCLHGSPKFAAILSAISGVELVASCMRQNYSGLTRQYIYTDIPNRDSVTSGIFCVMPGNGFYGYNAHAIEASGVTSPRRGSGAYGISTHTYDGYGFVFTPIAGTKLYTFVRDEALYMQRVKQYHGGLLTKFSRAASAAPSISLLYGHAEAHLYAHLKACLAQLRIENVVNMRLFGFRTINEIVQNTNDLCDTFRKARYKRCADMDPVQVAKFKELARRILTERRLQVGLSEQQLVKFAKDVRYLGHKIKKWKHTCTSTKPSEVSPSPATKTP